MPKGNHFEEALGALLAIFEDEGLLKGESAGGVWVLPKEPFDKPMRTPVPRNAFPGGIIQIKA